MMDSFIFDDTETKEFSLRREGVLGWELRGEE